MNNLQFTVQEINALQPLQVVEHTGIRDRFIYIWNTLWGEGTGEAAYEREAGYFNSQLRENANFQKATPFSIFNAFVDLAISGLSLEPGTRALAYLIGRNVNVGTKDAPRWEGRLKLTISAYGELVMRIRSGQIRHADNPVLVYANDEFSFSDRSGRKEVDYVCHLPHTGQPVVACYLRITRCDGTIDYSVMTEEDWTRLAGFSARQNKGMANALYGVDKSGSVHIDTGFLMAKCIKHAFKTYPKVRIGKGTEMQTEQEQQNEDVDIDGLYGIAEPQQAPEPVIQNPAPGVSIQTDDDDAF